MENKRRGDMKIKQIGEWVKIVLLIYIAVVISFMAIKQYKTQRQTLWDIYYASAKAEIAREDRGNTR